MHWNWQQKDWPNFDYDATQMAEFERQFQHQSGLLTGLTRHIDGDDKIALIVDFLSAEAIKTSEIEGEYLNRESVQSSIRRDFGLVTDQRAISPAEAGIAAMMINLYRNFEQPLTHQMLYGWHRMLVQGRNDLADIGCYRRHPEPMQIISGPLHRPNIHFEAPPSEIIAAEMDAFINWYNHTHPNGKTPLPALTRAGIAHLYFVSLHPFEDGNGRIARAITEKALSESLGRPVLIALSQTIAASRKRYYDSLERNNKHNRITDWMVYMAATIVTAQHHAEMKINFLINKTKFYDINRGQLNDRQQKVIARLFEAGHEGFTGGLSAENYIAITHISRATATRDLQDLAQKKILRREGELKRTRYYLNIPRTG